MNCRKVEIVQYAVIGPMQDSLIDWVKERVMSRGLSLRGSGAFRNPLIPLEHEKRGTKS